MMRKRDRVVFGIVMQLQKVAGFVLERVGSEPAWCIAPQLIRARRLDGHFVAVLASPGPDGGYSMTAFGSRNESDFLADHFHEELGVVPTLQDFMVQADAYLRSGGNGERCDCGDANGSASRSTVSGELGSDWASSTQIVGVDVDAGVANLMNIGGPWTLTEAAAEGYAQEYRCGACEATTVTFTLRPPLACVTCLERATGIETVVVPS